MDAPASTTRPPLRLQGINIAVAGHVLIEALNAEVAAGDVFTVMGPSGSGKSSLLAYIGGFLDQPFQAGGEIHIGTQRLNDLPSHRRRIGVLFQDDLLFPHLSVAGNLMFGLSESVGPRALRRQLVSEALVDAGLAGFEDRDPASLSGGQRARVALQRILLSRPAALLLDEPFNKLDAALREDFRGFVFDHVRREGLPTVLVTHDQDDARAAGGAVLRLG